MVTAKPSVALARARLGLTTLVGLGLFAVGTLLIQHGTYNASLVEWECFAGQCATNDLAGGAPMLGLVAVAVGAVLLIPTLRAYVTPLAVLTASLSALVGWRRAVGAGLVTSESVQVWTVVTSALAVLSLVSMLRLVAHDLRRSRAYYAWLGRKSTWGRVTDYENIDGKRCFGTLNFDDEAGTRHVVRTEVPRRAFAYPPRVCYDPANPTDPSTLRIEMPRRPLTAAQCDAQLADVRVLLPLPADATRHWPGVPEASVQRRSRRGAPR